MGPAIYIYNVKIVREEQLTSKNGGAMVCLTKNGCLKQAHKQLAEI